MYLLIRMWAYNKQIGLSFTFHNVSINSNKQAIAGVNYNNLHSIMYLLIPACLLVNKLPFDIYIP